MNVAPVAFPLNYLKACSASVLALHGCNSQAIAALFDSFDQIATTFIPVAHPVNFAGNGDGEEPFPLGAMSRDRDEGVEEAFLTPRVVSPPSAPKRCRRLARCGFCKYGANCRFSHEFNRYPKHSRTPKVPAASDDRDEGALPSALVHSELVSNCDAEEPNMSDECVDSGGANDESFCDLEQTIPDVPFLSQAGECDSTCDGEEPNVILHSDESADTSGANDESYRNLEQTLTVLPRVCEPRSPVGVVQNIASDGTGEAAAPQETCSDVVSHETDTKVDLLLAELNVNDALRFSRPILLHLEAGYIEPCSFFTTHCRHGGNCNYSHLLRDKRPDEEAELERIKLNTIGHFQLHQHPAKGATFGSVRTVRKADSDSYCKLKQTISSTATLKDDLPLPIESAA